jgi:two-component system sensor histidine kinase BarA
MTSIRLRWYHRLRIQNAYGQLVALIFLPIAILAASGAWLVLRETHRAALAEQRTAAQAILARYQPAGQALAPMLDRQGGAVQAQAILQIILAEAGLHRAALIDVDGRPRLSLGYGAGMDWPSFHRSREMFGPLQSPIGSTYGLRVGFASDSPIWLVIDMDNQPMQLARYQVWLVLGLTGLITLLMLLICLNFYSRRWISPIYEMRLHLQRMNAESLHQAFDVSSSGELRLLQKDIGFLLRRLHGSFEELKAHTEQTEDDLRRTLDELEIQNITYRKARDLAIHANNTKSAFLANISHELRTPLNSIDGFINLLSRRGQLSSEQDLYVQTIRKSSSHLLALINDVLDFSKIEAGKLVLEQAPFSLEEAVFDVMDMLSPLACDKSLKMAVFYYDDVPQYVLGDVLRFKQILTNLVSNAIKFTPDGEVTVRVSLENSTPQQHQIRVAVQDSGIGLSKTDRQKLFQSFGQGDPSVTRQFGGTGLGLAISRQLTRLMNGDVGFEDNEERDGQGKGSTFWFHVVLGRQTNTEPVWPNLSGWRVLANIDHPASRNVLRGYLNQMHISLEDASSTADLFGRLAEFEHTTQGNGWVIVDPDGDTRALLREIRTRYTGPLAVYAYQMTIDLSELQQYQAVPLYQPMSRNGIISLLQRTPAPVIQPVHFGAQTLHVLAVDDHLPNLMVLDALLSDLGVSVTTVSSGQDAIAQVRLRHERAIAPFDLIFMDIQMPRMSGLETSQRIRDIEQDWSDALTQPLHTPIIALTAHALADERDQLLAAGMDDYVGKPIQHEHLVHLLEHWTHQAGSRTSLALLDVATPSEPIAVIIDWAESLSLSANKPELALDLLHMLKNGLADDRDELVEAYIERDFHRMEQRAHRLQGATRYIGVPLLRVASGALEQQLMQTRKANTLELEESQYLLHDRLQQVLEAIEQLMAQSLDDWV